MQRMYNMQTTVAVAYLAIFLLEFFSSSPSFCILLPNLDLYKWYIEMLKRMMLTCVSEVVSECEGGGGCEGGCECE